MLQLHPISAVIGAVLRDQTWYLLLKHHLIEILLRLTL